MATKKVNLRYLPKKLSRKDKIKQRKMLQKSKKLYKKGIYYTRKNVSSFQSKPSKFVSKAKKIYNVDSIEPSFQLAKATGCKKVALEKIVNKGEGAYYSSGSRPNQTAQSWGIARLASALTSGKAAAVDYNILDEGCIKDSLALKYAKKAKAKFGHGRHRVPKV
jgi:Family of unknown function (DUF5824)